MTAQENLSPKQFFHGSLHNIPEGDMVRTRALPAEYGYLRHNFFTTNRAVAEDGGRDPYDDRHPEHCLPDCDQ